MAGATPSIAPLRHFVSALTALVERQLPEPALLAEATPLLQQLIARDDWLPAALAEPHPQFYRQYLLHADPLERFSVVSFVWGPGQATPVHDHTVWGLIGMLRGQEVSQAYELDPGGRAVPAGDPIVLRPGQVEAVSPRLGDIHRVHNAFEDQVSVSIHVYGANIGAVRRWVYPAEGGRKPFVSGYSNAWVPNLWDRSKDMPAP
jgi:3-mercaptopropionate dioxygenase